MRPATWIIALTAALFPSFAGAQDGSEITNARTPENAQRFLMELPGQMLVTAASRAGLSIISYRVVSFTHTDSCIAVIEGIPLFYGFNERGRMEANGSAVDSNVGDPNLLNGKDQLIGTYGLTKPPYQVNWATIGSIVQNPFIDALQMPGGEQRLQLNLPGLVFDIAFPTKEIASRARVAMETLMNACDKTAGTGF